MRQVVLIILALCLAAPLVESQVAALRGNTTITWDTYDVVLHGVDRYRVRCLVAGDPLPRIVDLPVIENWVEVSPGSWTNRGWPLAFSPVREFTAIAEGQEFCLTLTVVRDQDNPMGPAESDPSNEVCAIWPRVCSFGTQAELRACMEAL